MNRLSNVKVWSAMCSVQKKNGILCWVAVGLTVLTSVLCGQEDVRISHSEWIMIDSQCVANPVNFTAVSW